MCGSGGLNINTMQNYPKIAIIYLSYHSEQYIEDVVFALKNLDYPKEKLEFVIVDNLHPDYGSSLRFLEETIMPLSGADIPRATILPQSENLGFAGGNNAGIAWALKNGFDYVYLHNDDGFMAQNALKPIVEVMEEDKNIAVAQSLLLLHPDTEYLNNAGNSFHYLGFGFCDKYREKFKEVKLSSVQEISYASGAACLLRADLLKQYGMLDEDFFLYHEDLELCFRFRSLGYKIALVSNSIFYHKYKFSRSIEKFYYMERNRYGVMLMFFRWPTLVLLFPMMLVLELGLWLFAWRGGWLDKKVKVYKYWFEKDNWKLWLGKRKRIQEMRKVTDRFLFKYTVPNIMFQEKGMNSPLLKYVGNPLMTLYYWVVVKGLIWW